MYCKQNLKTKCGAVLCAAALLAGALSGCGDQTSASSAAANAGTSGASGTTSKEPVSFTVIVPYQDELPNNNNPVLKKIEEETNSKINIEWTPMISYGDKYNVIMSSGQMPDVLIVPDLKASTYIDAVANDQFWDLTSYLSSGEYDGFKNLNAITLKNSTTNGKNYAIPRERTIKRKDVCYRADWAKKAGLDAPDTIEKLYKMAKTFAEGDFDGNGKKDTIGLLLGTVSDGGGQTIDCLNTLVVANGGFNSWGVKDNKIVADKTTPEYLKTIKLLRQMCQEGIISKDFAITKTTSQMSEYIDKEKAGLWLNYGLPGTSDSLLLSKQKKDPNIKRSDIYGFTYMKDAQGNDRIPAETGYNGGIAFPKSSVKDEARLKSLLSVFNFLNTKEGQRLLNNGIEGRHYKVVDDTTCTEITGSNSKNLKAELNGLNQMGGAGNLVLTTVSDTIGKDLATARVTFKDTDLIADASAPLNSKEYSTNNSNLNKAFDTALFKYILGEINDSEFQAAIKTWQTSGGDKIAQEFTEDYNKSIKK